MEEFKNILEIIYFISAPLLVVVGYLALSQIKVAREQIEAQRNSTRVAAKRDSIKATSEQIARYGSDIIPLQNKFHNKVKEKEIKYFENSVVTISSGKISVTPCPEKEEKEKLFEIMEEFTVVMNAMEGFSIYFTSGVADESIAFRSLSNTFCTFVEYTLPLLVPVASDENRFSSTIRLFQLWHNRLETESMEKQKVELEKKLTSSRPQTINPLGSDA